MYHNQLVCYQHLPILIDQLYSTLIYDFEKHTRKTETRTLYAKNVIIVEGIFVLAIEKIRNTLDMKIFVEKYDEIQDVISKANKALGIMQQEKVYLFDDFEVDSDELNVVEGWTEIKE